MVLESTQATDQAKAAVKTNSRLLQEKLAEKSKQLSQLEQAKMQEEMNAAMAQLSETVGDDVPTFAEVEAKIEARYARATAAAEQQADQPRALHRGDRGSATGHRRRQGRASPTCAPNSASPELRLPDSGQHDEVVAVDDFVGDLGRQVVGAHAGDRGDHSGVDGHHAASERPTRRADDVDGVAGHERAGAATTPAGSRLRGPSVSARSAPASTSSVPSTSAAKAIHSLRAGNVRACASNVVPTATRRHRRAHR